MKTKTTPNEMRDLLKIMRGKLFESNILNKNSGYSEMTMRDMLKITRNLNENEEEKKDLSNKVTIRDVSFVEESIKSSFENSDLNIYFIFPKENDPHYLYVDDVFVYWGATINNILMFTYTINLNDNADTGVKYKYIEEGKVLENSDDYEKIVKKVEEFYNSTFFPYFKELMKQ